MAKKDESLLQKQWKDRDVQRIRNIVNKRFGDKTTTQIGYSKQEIEHKEGDIWEENGKQYTIQNGIKISFSKLDSIKKLFQMPLRCPKCQKSMKNKHLDKKMWLIHKMCFNCVLEYESLLKKEGKFDEYQKNFIKKSIPEYIKDLEVSFNEFINESNNSFITEEGDIETINGGQDLEALKKEFKEYIDKLKNIQM